MRAEIESGVGFDAILRVHPETDAERALLAVFSEGFLGSPAAKVGGAIPDETRFDFAIRERF